MIKQHQKFMNVLGHHESSPAAMAYGYLHETKYTNERMLQYLTNYIHTMATHKALPEHLEQIREICIPLNTTLEELGLTGKFRYIN